MADKSAIIFGGNGFIGAHLIKKLNSQGYNIVSADIKKPKEEIENVRYVICDVRNKINITEHFDEAYNLAAVHTTPGHKDYEYYDTNVFGALNICNFCSKNKIKKLFFTSSIAVYGPDENEKYENSDLNPVSAYGKSKMMAENISKSWLQNDKDNMLAIIRPAVVYGPDEGGNFTRLANALRSKKFFYPGRTDTIKSCIYVKELLLTINFAWDYMHRNNLNFYLYNGSINPPPTIKDICKEFNRISNFSLPRLVLPLLIMKIASIPFVILNKLSIYKNSICPERMDKLVKSTNIIPKRLKDDNYIYKYDLHTSLLDWEKENNFK